MRKAAKNLPLDLILKPHRCPNCRLMQDFCICDSLQSFENQTRLIFIIHWREYTRLSNSGLLAWRMLNNSSFYVHGAPDQALALNDLYQELKAYTPLLLHPPSPKEENPKPAIPIETLDLKSFKKKPALVILDGNWPQSRRMLNRLKLAEHCQRISLTAKGPSEYRPIRKAIEDDQLCTLEAIAYALEAFGESDISNELIEQLRNFVSRFVISNRRGGEPLRFQRKRELEEQG